MKEKGIRRGELFFKRDIQSRGGDDKESWRGVPAAGFFGF